MRARISRMGRFFVHGRAVIKDFVFRLNCVPCASGTHYPVDLLTKARSDNSIDASLRREVWECEDLRGEIVMFFFLFFLSQELACQFCCSFVPFGSAEIYLFNRY